MTIERIRQVFRNAGLYANAADDLLCEQLWVAARDFQPQAESLGTNDTLRERVARAISSARGAKTWQLHADEADAVLAELGLATAEAAPQPQAEPKADPVEGEPVVCICGEVDGHTTQCLYEHFLAYSGLEHDPMLRYAYFHGANVSIDRPTAPQPQPRPQASAEDMALVDEAVAEDLREESWEAWQRIRASLGVSA